MSRRDNIFYARGKTERKHMPTDWMTTYRETLSESITRHTGLGADHAATSPGDLELIKQIRAVAIDTLRKVEFHYALQGRMVPANTVSGRVRDMVEQLELWEPHWKISWTDVAGAPKEQLFDVMATAEVDEFLEQLNLANMEGVSVCLA